MAESHFYVWYKRKKVRPEPHFLEKYYRVELVPREEGVARDAPSVFREVSDF